MEISDSTHLIERPIFLDCLIRNAILNALAWTNGNQKEAAELLGISGRIMDYKLKAYGIPRNGKSWSCERRQSHTAALRNRRNIPRPR